MAIPSFGLFAADLHRSALEPVLADQEVVDAATLGAELQHRFGAAGTSCAAGRWRAASPGDEAAITRVQRLRSTTSSGPTRSASTIRPMARACRGSPLKPGCRRSPVPSSGPGGAGGLAGFDVDEIGFQRNSDWLL